MSWLIPEWLLALALTLFIADIFLSTEVMSWGGIVALSVYFVWRINPPWMWCILLFIVAVIVFASVYYLFFRSVIGCGVRRLMQRGAPSETIESIRNAVGVVHYVDTKAFFKWNGDELWPINDASPSLSEGDRVVVDDLSNGEVLVKRFPKA